MADDVSVACDKDPNFAVICNFLDNFKDLLGLPDYPYQDLQNDIKNTSKRMFLHNYLDYFEALPYFVPFVCKQSPIIKIYY